MWSVDVLHGLPGSENNRPNLLELGWIPNGEPVGMTVAGW